MTPTTDIAHWRTHIFSRLITIVLVLGIATAAPSIVVAVREGLWPVIAVDLLAIAWLACIWRLRGLPYRTRVRHFIAIVFFVATGMMVNIGQVAQLYLIAPPVFAAVLLGMRSALAALGLSGAIILGLGLSGIVAADVAGLPPDEAVSSLLVAMNFMFVGSLITVSCGSLLQKLEASLGELRLFANTLQEGQSAMQQLNAELRLAAAAVSQLNDKVVIARAAAPGQPQPIILSILRTDNPCQMIAPLPSARWSEGNFTASF